MRWRVLGLGLLSALALAPAAHAADLTKDSNVTIPASDGVNLVGDVYRPGDGKGRYPAVVDMEPYGRSSSTDYVPQGYARVNTDVRGSGMSGGALCLLCLREQEDVRDVVEWIAKQPWSNGHVALYGYSYSAITALLGAALGPRLGEERALTARTSRRLPRHRDRPRSGQSPRPDRGIGGDACACRRSPREVRPGRRPIPAAAPS